VIRVRWSSSGGCAPYAGTITAQYLQGDTDTTSTATFPISAPSGSLNTPDYCSFGGPSVVYTLNLQDSKRQTAVAETAVECSAARAPTPSATPTPVTPTPGFGM
jgi:hypothetical protein